MAIADGSPGHGVRLAGVATVYKLTRRRNAWGEQAAYAVPGGRDVDLVNLYGLANRSRSPGSWFVIDARPLAVMAGSDALVGLSPISADLPEGELIQAITGIAGNFAGWMDGDADSRRRFEAISLLSLPDAGFAPARFVSSSGAGRLRWREKPGSGYVAFLSFCRRLGEATGSDPFGP